MRIFLFRLGLIKISPQANMIDCQGSVENGAFNEEENPPLSSQGVIGPQNILKIADMLSNGMRLDSCRRRL